jgi:hypothetical protein
MGAAVCHGNKEPQGKLVAELRNWLPGDSLRQNFCYEAYSGIIGWNENQPLAMNWPEPILSIN